MKFTRATLAAASLALVSAAPTARDSKINDGDVFRIMTIRSGSDFQYGVVQAAQRSLYVNTPSQNATCSTADINFASFYISKGSLFLNTPDSAPAQQFFVDRSGMGQGVIQYATGNLTLGRNEETGPFAIDDDSNLVFRAQQDYGFQACPGAAQGGFSVWMDGDATPGGNQGCLGFIARAQKEDEPVTCTYTK